MASPPPPSGCLEATPIASFHDRRAAFGVKGLSLLVQAFSWIFATDINLVNTNLCCVVAGRGGDDGADGSIWGIIS